MSYLLQQYASAPSPERAEEILRLGPWFHNLHLPDGAQTAPGHPLGDFPAFKWRDLGAHLPHDLHGWTVLDIGCNAGFYSFELARRGATVTAIDIEPLFLRQAQWAAHEYGVSHSITFHQLQVYDLARVHEAIAPTYDLVLFLGVFYHLRYPMLALDIVASKVRRMLAFQTLTMPGDDVLPDTARPRDVDDRADFRHPGWPAMAFIEHELAGDPSNWWAPNHAAVEAMLRSSGLRVVSRPGHEMYVAAPDAALLERAWWRGSGAAELRAATGETFPAGDADGRDASG